MSIPERILNFINGEFCPPNAGQFIDNINPATGTPLNQVADSDAEDVKQAVQAAARAFPSWSALTASERSAYLSRLSLKLLDQLEEFARAESLDSGKPISLSRSLDIPRSARNLDFFAKAITQFHGESFRSDSQTLNYTDYSPLGVVACISPWNLPLYLFTWKIAPALAAGNTVVAKPSELTPLTAFLLARLCQEIGLPKGVLNILQGRGPRVGAPLVEHPEVKAISFTGSTLTGGLIAKSVAGDFKKLSLEMGGKNASLVFADCDFERTVSEISRSAFSNQGQICLCGSRILVERAIFERFQKALLEKVRNLSCGDPLAEKTQQGALVSEAHMNKVLSYIELAKKEGGRILTGGKRAELGGELAKGYFVEPTLITGLGSDCRTNQEEIFGPVATLIPFQNEAEALQIANSTRYGLSASVWTQDISRAQRLAKNLQAGIVWINTWLNRDLRTPFGGVKDSGLGREGGMHALEFFSEVKNICIHTHEA